MRTVISKDGTKIAFDKTDQGPALIIVAGAFQGEWNFPGAGMGYIFMSLAALFFGWLVNPTSARTGPLVCAIVMGLIAGGIVLFPFMKHLDDKISSEGVHEPTQDTA